MKFPRSYLFVPGDRVDRYQKALDSGAEAVIIDLEDAVSLNKKSVARDALSNWLANSPKVCEQVWVRINAASTEWHDDDLRLLKSASIAGIVLPKAECDESLREIATCLREPHLILPIIETARGIERLREIAKVIGVQRLLFGSIDLQLDLGIQCDQEETELAPFRAEIVLASRLANLPPPVDGVTVALEDESLLADAVRRARRMGFGAKLCIHPRQVAAVNLGFRPSKDEIAWASRVMEAVEKSNGAAVAVEGKMIDAPVVSIAQRILAQAM